MSRGVIWDLDGVQLAPRLAASAVYDAGFTDAIELTTMLAVLYGESAWYLRAWHHNVQEDEGGSMVRDSDGRFTVLSTDLGFIQRNVIHQSPRMLLDSESRGFVDELFEANPDLAKPVKSAKIARQLFEKRRYGPWYAHKNGSWKNHRGKAVLAAGNMLAVRLGLGQSYLEVRDRG